MQMLKNSISSFNNNSVIICFFCKVIVAVNAEKFRVKHKSLLLVSLAGQNSHAQQAVRSMSVADC